MAVGCDVVWVIGLTGRGVEEDEAEAYSDPDEGVEIVDMENVRTMDWMAPESLRKEKNPSKKKKVKAEEVDKKDNGECHVPAYSRNRS